MDKKVRNCTLRQQIVEALDILIVEVREKEINKALAFLQTLHHRFVTQEALSINSIVFDSFVNLASSPEALSERDLLRILKDELLGVVPYWNTVAIRQNLSKILGGNSRRLYLLLRELYSLLTAEGDNYGAGRQGNARAEELREQLHYLCDEVIVPKTIPELLVSQLSQAILVLPYNYPKEFYLMDESAAFSILYPRHSQETRQEHFDYYENMFHKMEGNKTLFIDVHILPEGVLLNLR